MLGNLIVFLTVIKSLQHKSNKDWFFLYIISFFQILLAAGLSISPALLFIFTAFVLLLITAIYFQEINNAQTELQKETHHTKDYLDNSKFSSISGIRLFTYSLVCICCVLLVGIPLFLIMPRGSTVGLGIGAEALGGISTGFSDQVRLGAIGRIQQSDRVVMRVQVEGNIAAESLNNLRWRGITLDSFNNFGWRQSKHDSSDRRLLEKENGFYRLGKVSDITHLTTQTVMLEPLDTNVIFGAPRLIALSGNFGLLVTDSAESITANEKSVRQTYKAYSDLREFSEEILNKEKKSLEDAPANYTQLPAIDLRIGALAEEIVTNAKAQTRYQKAAAIERYLQNSFAYSLDMKAGGSEPLADFLFNVRAGHCEYFSTAMAVMLRTQGIPTRVVNGFQRGQYNEMAGVYIVTEKEAHSWVEVYFPSQDAWVTFDPTPPAGFNLNENADFKAVYLARLNSFVQALETFWIQYIIGYDGQEQMSLFRSVKSSYADLQDVSGDFAREIFNRILIAWKSFQEGESFVEKAQSIGLIALYIGGILTLIVLPVSLIRFLAKIFAKRRRHRRRAQLIEFYEDMSRILAKQGFRRLASETPMEFAEKVGLSEVEFITEKYNEVRFGERTLTRADVENVGRMLKSLENRREVKTV